MSSGIVLVNAGIFGVCGDSVNEIGLTRGGFQKCAGAWQQALDPLLA